MRGLDKGVEVRHAPIQTFVKKVLDGPKLPGDESWSFYGNKVSNLC